MDRDTRLSQKRIATIRTELLDAKSGLITIAITLEILYNENVHIL